jgi:hypothetical protein
VFILGLMGWILNISFVWGCFFFEEFFVCVAN